MRLRRHLPALLVLLASCGPVPTPTPPHPVPRPQPVVSEQVCRDIWQQELHRSIDPSGLAGCLGEQRAGLTGDQIRARVKASPEWAQVHAPAPPTPALQPLHADGRIFRTADGQAWRYKGVSAFKLCRLFTDGQSIDAFLTDYAGFNVLRVWDYTPVADWKAEAWNSATPEQWRRFLAYVGARGWHVELTLLTDDDPARVAPAKALVQALASGARPTNLLVEIGNEPETHKHINTAALRATLDASGFLYASGNYEDSAKAFGSYLVTHTQRDAEWPRRIHDCQDFYTGRGPNALTDPAHHVPCVGDEPAKLEDVGGDHHSDWIGYFGACSQLGAGCTFHSQTGKFGQRPTAAEKDLAAAALEGLSAFPADAPLGAYRCLTCPGGGGDASLRTYTMGDRYLVRIRPTTPAPPGAWTRVGTSAILWHH